MANDQAASGGGLGNVLGQVVGVASQGNLLLAGAVQAIVLYRQARDAWKAAHPAQSQGDGDPAAQEVWLEDAELISLLDQDSTKLVNHANTLLAKYAAAPHPPEG